MVKSKLKCEIFFRFTGSTTIKSFIGEIRTKKLFYSNNDWVMVKTKRIFQNQLISDEFPINKSDIWEISILEPIESLRIDKKDLTHLGIDMFIRSKKLS